jgi:hypothetical protein
MSPQGFDPDAFMAEKEKEKEKKQQPAFDPDAFMAAQTQYGAPPDAPPPARPPLPQELTGKRPPIDPNASAIGNYLRGAEMMGPGIVSDIVDMPRTGGRQVVHGVEQIAEGNPRDIAGGTSKVIRGAGTAIAPVALPAAAIAAPIPAAVGMGMGALGSMGAEAALRSAGAAKEYQELGGDIGGIIGGGIGAKGGSALQSWLASKLGRSAITNYLNVLRNPEPSQVPAAEATAEMMAKDRMFGFSRRSLQERMAAEKKKFGPQAAEAYSGKPPVDPAEIFQGIQDLWHSHATVEGAQGRVITNPDLDAALQGMAGDLQKMAGPDGKIPAQALDQYRDQLFRGTSGPMGRVRQASPDTAMQLERGIAQQIKGVLDSAMPDAQKINDAYKMRARVWDFMEKARRRDVAQETGQPKGPAMLQKAGMKGLAKMAGMADMPLRVLNVVDTVPWQTASGALKATAADYLSRGAWENFMRLVKPFQKPPAPAPKGLPAPPDASYVRGVPTFEPSPYAPKQITTGSIKTPTPDYGPDPKLTVTTGEPLRAPVSRQLPAGKTPMPGALSGLAGDITDLIPVKDPVTGETYYIPRPQKRSGPITLGHAKGGILNRPPTRKEILRSLGG